MPNKHPLMSLSRDKETFLRHWMYDEVHYQAGQSPAKRLQVQHEAVPADLAVLIAATMPDPTDQDAAGLGPPPSFRLYSSAREVGQPSFTERKVWSRRLGPARRRA
jgi:hypothetical protein